MTSGTIGRRLAWAGGGFAVVTTVVGSAFSPLALPFVFWAAAPYALLWFLAPKLERPGPALGAGLAALSAEAAIRAAVFVWPQGSTAAIALLFSPAYIAVLVMPGGAALGFILGGLWERAGVAARALIALLAAAVLCLEFVAIARPEMFPTAVAERRRLQARIGPARVVVPGDLRTVYVSSASVWHQVVDFDGKPGDELALVDHRGARIMDLTTFEQTRHELFEGAPAQFWSWMSQLVPLEDGLAVAQTGGGFSETKLQRLDGSVLWTYQPDARLKPNALAPADLEGDRDWEFYASSNEMVSRLDLEGKEVWSRPARSAHLLNVMPRAGKTPAWVAGVEYGRVTKVWDEKGTLLGELPAPAKDAPFAVVDAPQGRALLHGGASRTARGYALDGTLLFETPLGEFALAQAVGLRFKDGPALALTGSAPKDVKRARLFIVDAEGRVLYDEVMETLPTLRAARRPDGTSLLLISHPGLRVLAR